MSSGLFSVWATAAFVLLGASCLLPPSAGAEPAVRAFKADKRYLVFPGQKGRAGRNSVALEVDGKTYAGAEPPNDHRRRQAVR